MIVSLFLRIGREVGARKVVEELVCQRRVTCREWKKMEVVVERKYKARED